MTTMTATSMDDLTQAEQWIYANKGSEDYNNKIGLLRTLFKLQDDPIAVATLIGGRKPQVKVKYEAGAAWETL